MAQRVETWTTNLKVVSSSLEKNWKFLAIQNSWQQYPFKFTDIVYKYLNYNYFQEGSLK